MNQGLAYEIAAVMPEVAHTGLQVSTATFQTLPNTIDALGQADQTNWVNVTGLTNIPCQLSVASVFRPDQGGTIRGEQGFDILGRRTLELNAYYSAADIRLGKDFSVLVTDSVGNTFRYEVMEVEPDSQAQVTRCAVRFWQK
jgi:hypothetical protein